MKLLLTIFNGNKLLLKQINIYIYIYKIYKWRNSYIDKDMSLFEIIQSSLKENYYYINFLKSNLIQVKKIIMIIKNMKLDIIK